MSRDPNRFETELSAADARFVEEMKVHMQPPPLSESMLRSLRTGQPRHERPRPWSLQASVPLAAAALAASLGLLVLFSPRTQLPTEALSVGAEGGWNYELFAPPELDLFSRTYDDEIILPVEYAAFEYWVD